MKKFILWFLAFVITISAAVYQRLTGPTYPQRTEVTLNDKTYKLKLVRSLSHDQKPEVKLNIPDSTISARLYYKRFRAGEEYQVREFEFGRRHGRKVFFAEIPQQPAAGKLEYYIEIADKNSSITLFREEPVVIRFKGSVPAFILIPHILIMFLAMLFSNLAGLMAIIKFPSYKRYGVWTLVLLIAGGIVLGPLVQYYAFGELWTGIPFGWDLTDNKTLIALVFWVLAVWMNRKEDKPLYTLTAAFMLLLVYSIPHSLFGSELDYSSGKVIQG